MHGYALRFYMHAKQRHRGSLLYEWLVGQAKKQHIHGGSAFHAAAGFGRHKTMLCPTGMLSWDEPVLVEFLVDETEMQQLVRIVEEDGAPLFWARFPAQFGTTVATPHGPAQSWRHLGRR